MHDVFYLFIFPFVKKIEECELQCCIYDHMVLFVSRGHLLFHTPSEIRGVVNEIFIVPLCNLSHSSGRPLQNIA